MLVGHRRPLEVGDGARVADGVALEVRPGGRTEAFSAVEQADRGDRLVLGARAGALVALERKEEDEADEDRVNGSRDGERPRRPLAVGEVAALRRAAAKP